MGKTPSQEKQKLLIYIIFIELRGYGEVYITVNHSHK